MADGLSNLFQNQLFLQMLSGGGQALQAGEPISAGLDPIIQQNIQAQSKVKLQDRYMKMLAAMLGKGVDFKSGADGKTTVSAEDMGTLFSSVLGGEGGGTLASMGSPGQGASKGFAPGSELRQSTTPPIDTNLVNSVLNPSASPLGDITASDLAGLTSEDVSQALAGAVSVAGLRSNIAYRRALTEQARANAARARRPADERTTAMRNYAFAQSQGYKGTFDQFQGAAETTHKRDYDEAVKGGYAGTFHDWMLEMARAGAINLGEVVERKKALGELEGQLYFKDPDWTDKVTKHLSSEDVANKIFSTDPEQRQSTREVETVRFIENKIITGGGTIDNVTFTNGIMTWTVTWPSGDTETISYGIRS